MSRRASGEQPNHGPVRTAFEVTFAAHSRLNEERYAALVALCRLLSTQIDEAGSESSNRLTAAYLSALKDVDRALGDRKPAGGAGGDNSGSALGKLQALRTA